MGERGDYLCDNSTKLLIQAIHTVYQKGIKVKLDSMIERYPLKEGAVGIVEYVDDAGIIFARWEDGRLLGLIYGMDDFIII